MHITDTTRPTLEALPTRAHAGQKIWGAGKQGTRAQRRCWAARIDRIWARREWDIPSHWRGKGKRPVYV